MEKGLKNKDYRLLNSIVTAVVLVGLYILWTRSRETSDLLIVSVAALLVSLLFNRAAGAMRITPRRVIYAIGYLFYLLWAIIRSNLDVARRVVQPRIPINPGIVMVHTVLTSPLGRTILANSITLTPGTLSVDISGNHLFIHWIDVTEESEEEATRKIVAGFEHFLEVIFG